MQQCSSLNGRLSSACCCLLVGLKFRLTQCRFMTGHALALVVAVGKSGAGKRCVYRRQEWKVAMSTGEEVYYTFHNF